MLTLNKEGITAHAVVASIRSGHGFITSVSRDLNRRRRDVFCLAKGKCEMVDRNSQQIHQLAAAPGQLRMQKLRVCDLADIRMCPSV